MSKSKTKCFVTTSNTIKYCNNVVFLFHFFWNFICLEHPVPINIGKELVLCFIRNCFRSISIRGTLTPPTITLNTINSNRADKWWVGFKSRRTREINPQFYFWLLKLYIYIYLHETICLWIKCYRKIVAFQLIYISNIYNRVLHIYDNYISWNTTIFL